MTAGERFQIGVELAHGVVIGIPRPRITDQILIQPGDSK